jgi:hypothetical protein
MIRNIIFIGLLGERVIRTNDGDAIIEPFWTGTRLRKRCASWQIMLRMCYLFALVFDMILGCTQVILSESDM